MTPAPGTAAVAGLYAGWVSHQRLRPRRHRLRYRVYALLLDLDALEATAAPLRWLSLNRFNLLSVHEADHGSGRPGPGAGLAAWLRERLREADLPDDGALWMMAMPRVLGHGFNPLSVHFCHDRAGRLRAVLYEVHNTFGERHGYLVEVPEAGPQGGDGELLTQVVAKDFHVSPFMAMALSYRFRLRVPRPGAADDGYALSIEVSDAQGPLLVAHQQAVRHPLTDRQILRHFVGHPLLTLKVVAGIHWEALKLWLKGVPVQPKPAAAATPITVHRLRESTP